MRVLSPQQHPGGIRPCGPQRLADHMQLIRSTEHIQRLCIITLSLLRRVAAWLLPRRDPWRWIACVDGEAWVRHQGPPSNGCGAVRAKVQTYLD